MTLPFGERLGNAITLHGRLCVGIDPHSWLLDEWGLPDTADGVRSFGLRVVDASVGRVSLVKPQVAFFERFGSAGFTALEAVIAAARQAGILVIADAKRGDVGSTVDAYAAAWLAEGSPLESDAMTISAFQGVGSISGALDLAARASKGLFVLAATSNPEGVAAQQARLAGTNTTVSRSILDDIRRFNSTDESVAPSQGYTNIGAVIGATRDLRQFDLGEQSASGPALPILAPGFGHQGADVSDASERYGSLARGLIVAESRSVLSAGPSQITHRITERAEKVNNSFA